MRHLLYLSLALFPCNLLFAQQDAPIFDDTVMQEVRLTLDPTVWQTLRDNFEKDDYYKSDFSWNDSTLTNIGIKSRGSGSRSRRNRI